MRVTSSKEIPPPPPRMPVTFHLDLSEDEALALVLAIGTIGGEYSAFRQLLDLMHQELTGELRRQEIIERPADYEPHAGELIYYPVNRELKKRGLLPSTPLFLGNGLTNPALLAD